MTFVSRLLVLNVAACRRSIHLSPASNLIQKWRDSRGLPLNPNECGCLTDGPDFSFADDRLAPPGKHQVRRYLEKVKIAEKIQQLTEEVDFAVEKHKQLLKDEEDRKAEILANKLKAKGDRLSK